MLEMTVNTLALLKGTPFYMAKYMIKKLSQITVIVFLFFIVINFAQSQTNSDTNQANITPTQEEAIKAKEKEEKNSKIKNYREGFKIVAEGSNTLIAWCLFIIGGSIAAILSTSYLRPPKLWMRLCYLLFIPGWVLISVSIYYGNVISGNYMAAGQIINVDILRDIGKELNVNFIWQLFYLEVGLMFFGLWLFLFLLWWIFGNWSISKHSF
jgi:hypothetical protein